ncbi:MAG: hypothetical protein KDI06_08675 [Calditrichaeota bacterium]|nr:hypothetical protein [Calditrichota bacterium]
MGDGCLICDEEAFGFPLCRKCFHTKQELIEREYNDYARHEIRDSYFYFRDELKNNPSARISNQDLIRFLAMAETLNENFEDSYLIERIEADLNELLELQEQRRNNHSPQTRKKYANDYSHGEKKRPAGTISQTATPRPIALFDEDDYRKKYPANFLCEDGHYVRSRAEVLIDNWFYHHRLVHAYEKKLIMPDNTNEIYYPDFYLPEGDVYIEFWGRENDPAYLAKKEAKVASYRRNGIHLIELSDREVERLDDFLPMALMRYIKGRRF